MGAGLTTFAAGAGRLPVPAGPVLCVDFTNRRRLSTAVATLEAHGYSRAAGALRRVIGNPGHETAATALVDALREVPASTVRAAGLTADAHGPMPSWDRGG